MGGSMVLQVLLVSLAAGVLLGCSLKNFTLHVEKQECTHCLTINTTVCSGMCFTQDSNLQGVAGRKFRVQRGCVYQSVAYRSAEVPGCPAHIDPLYIYPVAQRCRCSKCNTVTNECVQTPLQLHDSCRSKQQLQ
ncbi:thyrotropin subunit beta [Astyanax mexicanus]|uniref:thyrotropin subunit beta n=1 Tax=Astyanax mexicanus TaxID=7994 RepID=UPI0020CAA805|nr:thyrotropin subunit beta [Astyanax mexicanus]